MKPLDYLKAAGIALALLVANVLIAILAVAIYAHAIDTGHPHEYYEEAALTIVPWSCHIVGTILFFLIIWFLTSRRPDRNGYLFAFTVVAAYAIIDAASVGFSGVWQIYFAVSMLLKLVASLAGAYLGTSQPSPVSKPVPETSK